MSLKLFQLSINPLLKYYNVKTSQNEVIVQTLQLAIKRCIIGLLILFNVYKIYY